jgi:uncharacterized membrane protein YphA (DoxX/SURF4 family)
MDARTKKVSLVLRLGLALVFLYAGIASLINPTNWIGFIPAFIANESTRSVLLLGHSIFNIVLGLWLLSDKKIFYASTISVIFLIGIILTNLASIDIIFRDVAILFMAIALGVLNR